MSTSINFKDSDQSVAETLNQIASGITPGTEITLRNLLTMIGEQGLLLFCMFLTIPFLVPVQIPGVSTVFGLLIVLIGIGVTLNRVPWLPTQLMERTIHADHLVPALQRAAKTFTWIDRVIRPRLLMLTHGTTINRFNGVMLVYSALLLMAPLAIIPFSNMLPALAILALAAGILQRDGLFIVAGYFFAAASTLYFVGIAIAVVVAGQGLSTLIQ
jgi:hypothetical protein